MTNISSQIYRGMPAMASEFAIETILRAFSLWLVAFLAIGYAYFVSATALNVISQKQAERAIVSAESEITAIEQQYFSISHSITSEIASSLDLFPVADRTIVHATDNGTLAYQAR